MDELYTFGMTVLMGFFAIMNPIGNAPIYIGLVEGYSDAEKGRVARKSVLFAFIIVSIFVIFGGIIFKMFGISIQAFQMAGGILLFLVAGCGDGQASVPLATRTTIPSLPTRPLKSTR